MPEYLAPGVYVEEVSFRSKSIEGVSTTTTGFIGPARYGPYDMTPELITSLADFERTYGNGQQLEFLDGEMDNFLWHAVRAFFEEGGQRLYVMRTFLPTRLSAGTLTARGLAADGHAVSTLSGSGSGTRPLRVEARFPGSDGN